MSTLVTPSAKSHERVTGRWLRDIQANTRREWFAYYAKLVIGSPIPWLFSAYVCLNFISRAGLEIAAWGCALLTALYILVDRMSSNRELQFFRVGSDFFLLGYVVIGIITALNADTFVSGVFTLGGVRWVLLFYLITYCWELFPGVNRLFFLMMGMASFVSIYGLWQHFTGVDIIRAAALTTAPTPGHPFFAIRGFFNTPELLGTLLATLIPLTTAAFLLVEERGSNVHRYCALLLTLLFGLALMWTYRPGLWMSAGLGVIVTMLIQGRQKLALIGWVVGFFAIVTLITYGDPAKMFDAVQKAELSRAVHQREQINTDVKLWQDATWIGVGRRATTTDNYDPGTGNVYFQILAQSGVLGIAFYLLFILGFMLSTYSIFKEIPRTHYWHRVLISGGLAGQIAFHSCGLYWSTHSDAFALNFFILIISAVSYVSEHYSRGFVPDDSSL